MVVWSRLVCDLTAQTVQDGPTYRGMCDASAAVAIGSLGFIVANDEDNLLRVYRRSTGGDAVASFDMNVHLMPDQNRPETDIEGATVLGQHMFWVTSHGRNRRAKLRQSRARLFATKLARVDGRWTIVTDGEPYYDLIDDLVSAPQLRRFDLDRAAKRAPKDKDGLNIEGLTATPSGTLWIGFRNPLRKGKALIVPLHNPTQLLGLGTEQASKAELGFPIEIDLDGLGIRSIEYVVDIEEYLILAGPPAAGTVVLYRWSGDPRESPSLVQDVRFGSRTPEAFVIYNDANGLEVQFFCDDGTRELDGIVCKQLENPRMRRFRTIVWSGLTAADVR